MNARVLGMHRLRLLDRALGGRLLEAIEDCARQNLTPELHVSRTAEPADGAWEYGFDLLARSERQLTVRAWSWKLQVPATHLDLMEAATLALMECTREQVEQGLQRINEGLERIERGQAPERCRDPRLN